MGTDACSAPIGLRRGRRHVDENPTEVLRSELESSWDCFLGRPHPRLAGTDRLFFSLHFNDCANGQAGKGILMVRPGSGSVPTAHQEERGPVLLRGCFPSASPPSLPPQGTARRFWGGVLREAPSTVTCIFPGPGGSAHSSASPLTPSAPAQPPRARAYGHAPRPSPLPPRAAARALPAAPRTRALPPLPQPPLRPGCPALAAALLPPAPSPPRLLPGRVPGGRRPPRGERGPVAP